MATQSPLTPASTIGAYGVQPEKLSDYDKALEDSIKALEQRYASPNYFNVAAGFFKPQLGGFAASLGSAAQALGENVEKERESQLPIAKMRAELALSRINMGKEKDAATAFSTWKSSGKPMDEATYAHIVGLSPNSSVAAAAKAAYEGERAGQTLEVSQQQLAATKYSQAIEIAKRQREAGTIDEATYNQRLEAAEQAYGPKAPVSPTRPAGAQGTQFPAALAGVPAAAPAGGAPAPAAAGAPVAAGASAAAGEVNIPVFKLGPNAPRGAADQFAILQQEMNAAFPRAAAGDVRAQGDVAALMAEARRNGATIEGGPTGPTGLTPGDLGTVVSMLGGSTAGGPTVRGGPAAAGGVDAFGNATRASAEAPAARPAAPSPALANFKIKPTVTLQTKQAVTDAEKLAKAAAEKSAERMDEPLAKQYMNLQKITEPVAYTSAVENNKFILNEIDKNPRLMAQTTNLLRKAGPFAAMMQKGVGISFAGMGAGVNIDVKAGLQANLPPEQMAFYDKLANGIAQSVYNDLRVKGQDPDGMGAEKFGQAVMREMSMDQNPKAIRHALVLNQLRLEQARDMGNAYRVGLKAALDAGSATPHYDAYNQHPEFKIVQRVYDQKVKQANDEYTAKPKKDKP